MAEVGATDPDQVAARRALEERPSSEALHPLGVELERRETFATGDEPHLFRIFPASRPHDLVIGRSEAQVDHDAAGRPDRDAGEAPAPAADDTQEGQDGRHGGAHVGSFRTGGASAPCADRAPLGHATVACSV
jgi:hypothetical protein